MDKNCRAALQYKNKLYTVTIHLYIHSDWMHDVDADWWRCQWTRLAVTYINSCMGLLWIDWLLTEWLQFWIPNCMYLVCVCHRQKVLGLLHWVVTSVLGHHWSQLFLYNWLDMQAHTCVATHCKNYEFDEHDYNSCSLNWVLHHHWSHALYDTPGFDPQMHSISLVPVPPLGSQTCLQVVMGINGVQETWANTAKLHTSTWNHYCVCIIH